MLDYQFLRCTFSYNLVMESIYEEQWVKSFVWTLGIVQSCFLSFFYFMQQLIAHGVQRFLF